MLLLQTLSCLYYNAVRVKKNDHLGLNSIFGCQITLNTYKTTNLLAFLFHLIKYEKENIFWSDHGSKWFSGSWYEKRTYSAFKWILQSVTGQMLRFAERIAMWCKWIYVVNAKILYRFKMVSDKTAEQKSHRDY